MAWVYILKTNSGKYYIGSTTDLSARLKQHAAAHTFTTKRLGLDELVLSQEYATAKEARVVERKIKKLKRRDYIEQMIKDGYIRLLP